MLERLEVRNYVLIKSLVMEFPDGFAVLTGETGSGKSIILGALGLVLGEKARADIVRQGEKEAHVEALFSYRSGGEVEAYLKSCGLDSEDGGLFIQRIVRSSGRSIMSVNGYSVSREQLEELGRMLVDVSSQHAHQSLLRPSVQLSYNEALAESARLVEENEKAGREADYIRFCLDEIEKADVKPGEDDELADELRRISQSGMLTEELDEALEMMRGGGQSGALSTLNHALNAVRKAMKADPSLESYAGRIESASIEIEDIAASLGDYLSGLSFSEDELEEKNARLSLLQRMKKKYGGSLEAVLSKRDEFRSALETIENFEDLMKENAKKVVRCREEMNALGSKLTGMRTRCASALEKSIMDKLSGLGLKNACFRIAVGGREASPSGFDDVVFLLAANRGEKEGPISQVASGGELSRIMLAVKSALSAEDEVETLLFDEIDSGLGGTVANSVAKELETLSRSHQVIAISHLAQIAAKAGTHFLVNKTEEGDRTVSTIGEISGEERVDEIARLLSGEVGKLSREHARSLLGKK